MSFLSWHGRIFKQCPVRQWDLGDVRDEGIRWNADQLAVVAHPETDHVYRALTAIQTADNIISAPSVVPEP